MPGLARGGKAIGGRMATAGDAPFVFLPNVPRLATTKSVFGVSGTSPIAALPATSPLRVIKGTPGFSPSRSLRGVAEGGIGQPRALNRPRRTRSNRRREPGPREGASKDVNGFLSLAGGPQKNVSRTGLSFGEAERPLPPRLGRRLKSLLRRSRPPPPSPRIAQVTAEFLQLAGCNGRGMDWDARLSSILVETDSNMAKIKQHLNTDSISSKADLLVGRINIGSPVPTQPPLHSTCGIHPCCRMANEELSTISQQLHSQAQIIESLTQAVCRLKQEKEQQQQSINYLEGEMNRLQHNSPGNFESLLGCRMEGLKNELCSLRQHVLHQSDGDCTPDLFSCPGVMQDTLESKKILWQEYECIKREIDQLKHKLDCQEEELYNQVSATHEIKRIQNRYCKMLEELINTHKAQVQDFGKTRNETQNTQQELNVVKSTVTDLKEQVKCLSLEDKYTMQPKKDSTDLEKNELLHEEDLSFSFSSDDSISEFSLTDVSSDELFSETEGVQLVDDKVSLPNLKLENIPGEAIGGMLGRTETSSELSTSLPELNFSDL